MNTMLAAGDGSLARACKALEYLNRNCKGPQCDPVTKAAVYRLYKRPLVRWLCEAGYCTGVTRDTNTTRCRNCGGSGKDFTYGTMCRNCQGTGRYSPYGACDCVLNFWFSVDGDLYRWHMPESLVDFAYPTGLPPSLGLTHNGRRDDWSAYTVAGAIATIRRFLESVGRRRGWTCEEMPPRTGFLAEGQAEGRRHG